FVLIHCWFPCSLENLATYFITRQLGITVWTERLRSDEAAEPAIRHHVAVRKKKANLCFSGVELMPCLDSHFSNESYGSRFLGFWMERLTYLAQPKTKINGQLFPAFCGSEKPWCWV
ncbi:MAG: hypothetical protein ACI9BW_002609, partial [Gammaproteobacteria bacterium]